jgi:starvation-inducible DNA-binding protein
LSEVKPIISFDGARQADGFHSVQPILRGVASITVLNHASARIDTGPALGMARRASYLPISTSSNPTFPYHSARRLQMNPQDAKTLRKAPLDTPTDLKSNAVKDISGALTMLLADMFALYVKTKNFHWHVSGPHFRDHHLLLDEQAEQIFAATDDVAERVRKIGGTTLRSIGHIARLQRVLDNDADYVTPMDMLAELRDDNKQLVVSLRETHGLCDEHGDVASASLIENWIDEAERRTWFLFETTRAGARA